MRPWCPARVPPAAASGRLADKFKGLGLDGLVSPGTILSDGDVTINMQVRVFVCGVGGGVEDVGACGCVGVSQLTWLCHGSCTLLAGHGVQRPPPPANTSES